MNIEKILDDHKEWLLDNTKGQRADLREANLSEANLSRADLREADLIGANLIGANLIEADLSSAYLSGANLRGANLSRANLSEADLGGANLYRADLSYTDVFTFTLGAHFGFVHFGNQYAEGSYVRIGCESHGLDYWLENFESIGNKHNYTKAQITNYGRMLNMLNLIKLESDLAKMGGK
jgi:uncharacterized protein YjbI with pentapeptide repeats